MKILRNLSLLGATVALSSCGVLESMQQPLGDDGFNPLDKPGTARRKGLVSVGSSSSNPGLATGHGFKNGDIVEVAIANTALFKRVPQPGDRYTKVLKVGDSLRVVGTDKDFLKVVAPDGKTGYVSSVMVISQGSSLSGPSTNIAPLGDIAPPPEIPGISGPSIAPIAPLPVPSITEPVPVDPIPVPSLPDPAPVPSLPDPDPAPAVPSIDPDPAPVVPDIPSGGPAPEPEIPSLPE